MDPTLFLAAEELTVIPDQLIPGVGWFTNSVLVTIIVTVLIIIWARRSTKKMQLVPQGAQNLFEALVETLYLTFESIVGKHMIPKAFPLLATLAFVYVRLVCLDDAASRLDRLSGAKLCSKRGFERRSQVCLVTAFPFCRVHRAGLNSDPPGFTLLSVIWQYVCRRNASAYDADTRQFITDPDQLDCRDSISSPFLFS